jgi:succinate dehydrogenase / fumarate reductase flavoprotein subunit
VADITGQAILHVLYEQLMKYSETVDRFEEWFTTSLIRDAEGACVGCIARTSARARWRSSGQERHPRLRRRRPGVEADDQRAHRHRRRHRAGLPRRRPLMDMEMVQYHPTTLVENGFLITEGARGEGAHLLNGDGERFMEKYAPNKMELASRDVVSRAEQTEINEGRGAGPNGEGIYLDVTGRAEEAHARGAARDRQHRQGLRRRGHHPRADPHPPGQHYIMGGVRTDADGATPVPGLYAAGEVACVSVHGGNRLGANSLLDTLIFGRRAGAHAASARSGWRCPTGPPARRSSPATWPRSTRSSPARRPAAACRRSRTSSARR